MTKKKRNATTLITIHPATPEDIITPLKPRRLKARIVPGGFELQVGATDLGLVRGDKVTGAQGIDGIRYIDGYSQLRPGTWSAIPVAQFFCHIHGEEAVDQITEDWRGAGAIGVTYRGGVVYAFWPAKISKQDAVFAVERSAAEFDLPFEIVVSPLRSILIREQVDLAPFGDTGRARGAAA